ncbi:hypothetical protein EDB81DRAFT_757591 [Dactylonectria macrodidyma]|uniref:Uncharacterized protein n=1 Tax=Dactylonectria macrodidyma TaxID=307937 RepID=A0A9P9JGK5_9HYPO|nr:hypothetical protein EDB81DRAFT_757591 [Dactylonectria macrodidyma]
MDDANVIVTDWHHGGSNLQIFAGRLAPPAPPIHHFPAPSREPITRALAEFAQPVTDAIDDDLSRPSACAAAYEGTDRFPELGTVRICLPAYVPGISLRDMEAHPTTVPTDEHCARGGALGTVWSSGLYLVGTSQFSANSSRASGRRPHQPKTAAGPLRDPASASIDKQTPEPPSAIVVPIPGCLLAAPWYRTRKSTETVGPALSFVAWSPPPHQRVFSFCDGQGSEEEHTPTSAAALFCAAPVVPPLPQAQARAQAQAQAARHESPVLQPACIYATFDVLWLTLDQWLVFACSPHSYPAVLCDVDTGHAAFRLSRPAARRSPRDKDTLPPPKKFSIVEHSCHGSPLAAGLRDSIVARFKHASVQHRAGAELARTPPCSHLPRLPH